MSKFQLGAAAALLLSISAGFAVQAQYGGPADPGTFGPRRAAAAAGCADGSHVTVQGADICGLDGSKPNTFVYEGIPYATATRWQPSTLAAPASMSATIWGHACPQTPSPEIPQSAMGENCLTLNIWKPKTHLDPMPVMVFIHGGAFLTGAGSTPMYDGSGLALESSATARSGVIVVTLDYRLGALGFMVSNEYGVASPGNLGVLDQQRALEWIHTNIAAFGGDTRRIMVFGESAGAMSTGLHLFDMPGSQTYFASALMQSNPMGTKYNTNTAFENVGNQFLEYLCATYKPASCDANWFNSNTTLPWQNIVTWQSNFLTKSQAESDIANKYLLPRGLLWAPVIDDVNVWGEPYAGYATYTNSGGQQVQMPPKPFAFGVNLDEGALFSATIFGGSSLKPSKSDYHNALFLEFGYSNAYAIENNYARYKISTGQYCWYHTGHKAPPLPPFCYYSPYGQSMANVITDFSFVTGNIVAAGKALSAASAVPVYAYKFAQRPLFDSYAMKTDKGSCKVITRNVCHGNELPYVFGTLGTYVANVPDEDSKLSGDMMAAWAQFASDPDAPGPAWTGFATDTQLATRFDKTVKRDQPFGTKANTDFWAPIYAASAPPKTGP